VIRPGGGWDEEGPIFGGCYPGLSGPSRDATFTRIMGGRRHALDYGCLHQYFHGAFRAFVGDMLPNEQRTAGLTMQSFFIGTGAVIASALPYILTEWLNISNTASAMKIPDSVEYSFYIGGAVFFLAVLWTVISIKEYSPDEISSFEESIQGSSGPVQGFAKGYDKKIRYFFNGFLWMIVGGVITFLLFYFRLNKELHILGPD